MHTSVMNYIVEWATYLDTMNKRILDVGSYDVNGSPRYLFNPNNYIGMDIRRGPSVNIVADSTHLPFRHNTFDLIICSEMLEHDRYPWWTLEELERVIRPKGHIILTARGYDEYGNCTATHDYPSDYYRYSLSGIRALCTWAGLSITDLRADTGVMPGVLAVLRRS